MRCLDIDDATSARLLHGIGIEPALYPYGTKMPKFRSIQDRNAKPEKLIRNLPSGVTCHVVSTPDLNPRVKQLMTLQA